MFQNSGIQIFKSCGAQILHCYIDQDDVAKAKPSKQYIGILSYVQACW